MKKVLFAAMVIVAQTLSAQTLGYNDIGVLFSKEPINGSARFNAMSGAFGALGGDLSALEINPAGAAVFLNSEFSASLSVRNTEILSNFYGNNEILENDVTNLSQAGGVLVFKNHAAVGWNKFAIGFNYSLANDFENLWLASGNSNYPTFIDDPNDSNIQYLNSDGQYFENLTTGQNRKYTFSFASQYNDNLYVGASINTYDVEYYQRALLEEYNFNGNGNNLDASLIQELLTYGDGVSFSMGIISKPTDNLRLGLAYQSPVWYNLAEDYIDYDIEVFLSNTNELITDYSGVNAFDYKLRTPSKLTGSIAYVFEKQGLISLDYTIKNYSNIKLSGSNFTAENQAFSSEMENVGALRIGTEWLIENFSIRGGYHTEKSPYKNAFSSDDLSGYSFGAGFKFRGGKLDFSYQKSSNTAPYNFYPQYNQVQAAELDIDNSQFTATLVLNI